MALLNRQSETSSSVLARAYPIFWKRFAAYLIDIGLVFIALGAVASESRALGGLVGIALAWLYFALMESSPLRATVGKLALGMVVTDEGGNRIHFGRATGRYFGKYLSGLFLGVGFLLAAFTSRKQALHDMIARTLVVNKR